MTSFTHQAFIFFFSLSPVLLFGQEVARPHFATAHHSILVRLTPLDSTYQLPHEFIIAGSEQLLVDSVRRLQRGTEYDVDYRFGIVVVSPSSVRNLFSDSLSHYLRVTYRALPLAFKKEYSLRQLVVKKDSLGRKEFQVEPGTSKFSAGDLFGSDLQKSGSIVRGFTLGSNRDMTLSSGFRMQLSGKLSKDIHIVAALTDENSPIQPEGTTQTLQEVDKVFVELSSAGYSATLGDFNLEIDGKKGGEFGRLNRKLQGATGRAQFGETVGNRASVDFSLTAATARGKFNTNQFQGIEGNQGPYRLRGRSGETRLLVVAGTERVYVNGELMTRGETNDYTIDYASGDLLFTSRRLITNASRITVDFEYSDREFTRNLISAQTGTSLFDDRLHVQMNLVQEADDPDSPIDTELDAAARERLKESGNDRFKAALSGIRLVGRDSLTQAGKGQYLIRDTTIGGKMRNILVYRPGDFNAIYAVSFSYVDRMPPDSAGYTRVGAGQYRFAGIGTGNYLPIQFLPMPQLHRVMNLHADARISPDFSISGEYALSGLDLNRLSALDDGDRQGGALKLSARYSPKDLRVGSSRLGGLDLSLSERFVDGRFVSADRANEIEFGRKWDLPTIEGRNEEIREGFIVFRPNAALRLGGGFGQLERQGAFRSRRTQATVAIADSSLPILDYDFEKVSSENILSGDKSSWIRQKGIAEYNFWRLLPGLRVESEERKATGTDSDSTLQGSFRFLEIAPRVAIQGIGAMAASAEFQFRKEDSTAAGRIQPASNSLAQIYNWQLREWGSFSSNLTLNIKNTKFTEEFRRRGNKDSEIILVRSHSRYAPLQRAIDADGFYEFSSQRSAQLERLFVRVAKGSGNYRYAGDTNGNGIADENEFELTRFDGDFVLLLVPGDQLIPVVDLKTSIRLRLQPQRLIPHPSSLAQSVLRSISTETYVRVEERSTETDTRQIYLLNFNRFQNDNTTIAGTNLFTQDVHIFENDPDLSFRLRFQERRGFLRLINTDERSYTRERSLRVRSQLVPEIGNQTEYVEKIDQVGSSVFSIRARDLHSHEISSEFSYRPERQWEIGFRLQGTSVKDRYENLNVIANINQQSLRLTYAIEGAGQVRAEVRREEVVQSGDKRDLSRPLPFEFTGGRVVGRSYFWQLAFDYRIYQYVQVALNYNGRSEGGRAAVHMARAEVRAFF